MVKISPSPLKSPENSFVLPPTAPPDLVKIHPMESSKLFPSVRLFFAVILCLCFVSLAVATSNLSVSMVCMIRKHNITIEDRGNCSRTSTEDVEIMPCSQKNRVDWSPTEQGFIFAAQNVGSLLMLVTGSHADKLNGKWAIVISLILMIVSNAMVPLVAQTSVWLAFAFRVVVGLGDAFLFPSASSIITRWFPPKERPFAIGLVTGGRQIGSLLILPVAGFMCGQSGPFGGWQSIFYLSAIISFVVLILWLLLSADKPKKHCCVSKKEDEYIQRKIEEESLGKRNERGPTPWKDILKCRALYVGVAALVCHEYPLVIMLQLLPKYFSDVLKLSNTTNGLISALPIGVLWISKTLSSSMSSLLTANQKMNKTTCCKMFNFIASLGLGVCIGITPLINNANNPVPAVIVLCLANAFAGLHTPGVQTALVQIAPAYSGVVTGISFSVVAAFSIFNKVLSNTILATGSTREWTIVFEISAVFALLPVVFFSLWGSADVQPWASKNKQKEADTNSNAPSEASVTALAKFSMYMTHQVNIP